MLWLMLSLAEICRPLFKRTKQFLGITGDSFSWHLFQSVRTYLIDESGEDTSLSAEMPQQIVGGRYTISYGEQEEENVWNAVVSKDEGFLTNTEITITVSDDCSSVLIDGEEYCRGEDGLNIILFDQNRKTVVDSVTLVIDGDGDVVLER